jgi:hypothetical protein
MWLFVFFLFVSMGAVYLFFALKPGIKKFKGGLNWLVEYGFNGAEVRFTHQKSGNELVFRLMLIGGVKQIHIIVDKLHLNTVQRKRAIQILDQAGLKLEISKTRTKNEFINVGHSRELANLIAIRIAKEVMNWTALTRFTFSFEGINLHPSR